MSVKADVPISDIQTALSRAISARDLHSVCKWSRALSDALDRPDEADLPDPWTNEIIEESGRLLRQAAEISVDTPYEKNCAARPENFALRVRLRREEKAKFEAILEHVI